MILMIKKKEIRRRQSQDSVSPAWSPGWRFSWVGAWCQKAVTPVTSSVTVLWNRYGCILISLRSPRCYQQTHQHTQQSTKNLNVSEPNNLTLWKWFPHYSHVYITLRGLCRHRAFRENQFQVWFSCFINN